METFVDFSPQAKIKQYQHSGKAPVVGVMSAILIGSVVAAGGGIVYCNVVTNVQMVIAEVVFSLMYAFAFGLTTGVMARKGKIRSTTWLLICVFTVTLVGLYFEWAFHPFFALGEDQRFVAWSPIQIMDWGQAVFQKGGEINGWTAVCVWALEATAIFVFAGAFAISQISHPFCEKCDCWTESREGIGFFKYPFGRVVLIGRLFKGNAESLLECEATSPMASSHLRLDMHMCPLCMDACFLTATHVSQRFNAKGEKELKEQAMFENIRMTPDELAAIIAVGTRPSSNTRDLMLQ